MQKETLNEQNKTRDLVSKETPGLENRHSDHNALENNTQQSMSEHSLSPFLTGIKCRCPRCGKGDLFYGLLRFASECSDCHLSYSFEDVGDGGAIFVMLVVGIFLVPIAILFQLIFHPPFWLHILIWGPLLTLACVALLRPFKGVLFALQYKYNAKETHYYPDQD